MLRNSKEIETNQHNNTPTNDGFIETELKAETSSSQDAEKAESDTNDYLNSSESSQDDVELKAETSSSQSSQNTENADANDYLSSSDSEQDEKSQQATAGFGIGLLPDFVKSMLGSIFGGLSSNEDDIGIEVIEIEIAVPPLPLLAHLVEEVHNDIHLLQVQQEILQEQQKKLVEMQLMLTAKQQKIATEINLSEAKEKSMQADLGRFYGKRITFFCETGKPTQLVNVQAAEEKKNENDDQSSLRASM